MEGSFVTAGAFILRSDRSADKKGHVRTRSGGDGRRCEGKHRENGKRYATRSRKCKDLADEVAKFQGKFTTNVHSDARPSIL